MPSQIVNHAAKELYKSYLGVLITLTNFVENEVEPAVRKVPEDYAPPDRIWQAPERSEIMSAMDKVKEDLQRLTNVTKRYEETLVSRGWQV
jgi:hypothetical protein